MIVVFFNTNLKVVKTRGPPQPDKDLPPYPGGTAFMMNNINDNNCK